MKSILTTMSFCLCAFFLFAQIQVPRAVNQAFKDGHPTHDFITWTMDGSNYKGNSIGPDKLHYISVYDANGNLLRSESELAPGQFPESIVNYFNQNLPEISNYSIWKVESNGGKTAFVARYDDKVDTQGLSKDGKQMTNMNPGAKIIHFDTSGNFVSK